MTKSTAILTPILAALWLISTSPFAYAVTGKGFSPEIEAESDEADDDKAATPAMRPSMPNTVAGSYLSSQFARSSGNIDQAIVQLRRVHERQPENTSIAVQLQGMLLLQGNVEEAANIAESIQDTEGKDSLSDLVLTLRALRNGNRADAATILQSSRDGGNQQLWVPLLLGWVDQAEGNLTSPLTKDAFSADIGRAAPLINYHLALINSQAGFNEEAAKNFKDSIEDTRNAPPRIMDKLTQFYHAKGKPPILADLVKDYEQNTDSDDEPMEIHTAEDGIAEVLYTMGGIMFGAGVVNDAAIYMQLANYVKPDFADAQVALGDAYGELKQYERSNQAYARVSPESPLYTKSQLHIAVNLDRMGKFKQAIDLLDKLNREDPDDTDAIVTKGDLYRIHSRYEEAIQSYTEALKHIPELQPADWPILFARGSCLERMGRWPQAEKDLKAALELKPDQPDILNYLGFAQLEHNQDKEEAKAMIARAVEARPGDAQIIDSMGWVLYLQGDYDNSRGYLEKAVELLPSDPTVNDHLGDVYWRLGRKTEARFQWNRALTYAPEPRLVTLINKKIKDGLPDAPPMPPMASAIESAPESATP